MPCFRLAVSSTIRQRRDSRRNLDVMCGYPSGSKNIPFWRRSTMPAGDSPLARNGPRPARGGRECCGILGARAVHFDFLDCIYRRGRDGNWLYDVDLTGPYDVRGVEQKSMEAITSPPHEEDADLPSRIAQAVSGRLTRDDVLVCQLAVGSHVDHVLVRQAAELLGRPIVYDIDIPYLFYKPEELARNRPGWGKGPCGDGGRLEVLAGGGPGVQVPDLGTWKSVRQSRKGARLPAVLLGEG
jgi:hypothetical protein